MNRKLIAITPVLLLLGIIAQAILLTGVILLYVPLLIWPEMVDPAYRWITRGMARIMARSIAGRTKRTVAVVVNPERQP